MEFDKDGRIILPKKPRKDSKKPTVTFSEKIEKRKSIGVVKEGSNEVLPTVIYKCTKCGHDKAYFWTIQTRASDETETKFFKCVKCSHTSRDYD